MATAVIGVALWLFIEDALVAAYDVPLPVFFILMIPLSWVFPEGAALIVRWWKKGNGNG